MCRHSRRISCNVQSEDQRTVQLSAAALGHYETLDTGPLVVQQNGYVSVYVGNESAADVYFDDLTIEHRQGLQVQENQYDPFGLDLAGVSGAAPGLRLKNFYQFNGKEFQTDLGLGWSDYGARFYTHDAPHWLTIDPLAEKMRRWSPYVFSFNNPMRFIDADGMEANDVHVRIGSKPVGTTKLPVLNRGSRKDVPSRMVVNVYRMTVTDDATNKETTYLVTRDGPVLNKSNPRSGSNVNINNTALEPKGTEGHYKGVMDKDYPRGTNLPALVLKNENGGAGLPAQQMPGANRQDPEVATGNAIHVGGLYNNPAHVSVDRPNGETIAGSLGCVTIPGGAEEIKAFGADIDARMKANQAAGTGIGLDVTMERRDDVQKTFQVPATSTPVR